MTEPRQHHTVSSGYLQAWASGPKEQVHAFRIESGTWRPQIADKLSRRRDFYRVDQPGIDPLAIEHGILSRLEDAALPAIREMIARRFPITLETLKHVVLFASMAYLRTGPLRKRVLERSDRSLVLLVEELNADREAFEKKKRQIVAAGAPVDDFTFEDFQRSVRDKLVELKTGRDNYLRAMVDVLWGKVATSFAERNWSLLERPLEAPPFVTSDHPVSIVLIEGCEPLKPLGDRRPTYTVDALSRDTVTAMPLSPDLLLVGCFRRPSGLRTASTEEVLHYNTATILPGRTEVYSVEPDFRFANPRTQSVAGPDELPEIAHSYLDTPEMIEADAQEMLKLMMDASS